MKCLLLQFSTLHLYNTETYLSIFKYASPFPLVKDFLFHVEVDKSHKKMNYFVILTQQEL